MDNRSLHNRLQKAVDKGELSEEEANQIHRTQREQGGYEGIESTEEDDE